MKKTSKMVQREEDADATSPENNEEENAEEDVANGEDLEDGENIEDGTEEEEDADATSLKNNEEENGEENVNDEGNEEDIADGEEDVADEEDLENEENIEEGIENHEGAPSEEKIDEEADPEALTEEQEMQEEMADVENLIKEITVAAGQSIQAAINEAKFHTEIGNIIIYVESGEYIENLIIEGINDLEIRAVKNNDNGEESGNTGAAVINGTITIKDIVNLIIEGFKITEQITIQDSQNITIDGSTNDDYDILLQDLVNGLAVNGGRGMTR